MKNVVAILVLLLSLSTKASIAFTVEGELQVNLGEDSDLAQFILSSNGRRVKVTNVDHKISGCRTGLYEIVNNYYPEDTYSLLEVYACYEELKGESKICPEIYQPVCGVAPQEQCQSDSCTQVLPTPRTYENYCVLHNASANFVALGECDQN